MGIPDGQGQTQRKRPGRGIIGRGAHCQLGNSAIILYHANPDRCKGRAWISKIDMGGGGDAKGCFKHGAEEGL